MDDLISRQAAISVIAKWMLEYGGEGEERERNALKQAAEEIKALPSAQPVRHGKWVPKYIRIGGQDLVLGMKCSECGEDALYAEGDEFLTDYCPNCGAQMEKENEQ